MNRITLNFHKQRFRFLLKIKWIFGWYFCFTKYCIFFIRASFSKNLKINSNFAETLWPICLECLLQGVINYSWSKEEMKFTISLIIYFFQNAAQLIFAVCSPRLITFPLFSTNYHPWVNWQTNPRCHELFIIHFKTFWFVPTYCSTTNRIRDAGCFFLKERVFLAN